MSGVQRIARPRRGLGSLVNTLRDAGVKVPDQELIARLMDAASLGFNLIHYPDPYHPRVRLAFVRRTKRWYRRAFNLAGARAHEWKVFDYSEYAARTKRTLDYGSSNMPPQVKQLVKVIRHALPGVELKVHALHSDPFLQVLSGEEKIFVAGWRGRWVII